MRIEINTRTRTVWVWTDRRAYNDAAFESKHPRDKDGKFTSGGSAEGKTTALTTSDPNYRAKVPKGAIARQTDFHEIPKDVANSLTDAIKQNMSRYPFMADHFSFVGSTQAQLAHDLGDNIGVDDNVEAFYKPEKNGMGGRMCFSLPALRASQILPQDNKWHPVGTNTIKGVADHEFGHALWHRLGLNKDDSKSPLKEYIDKYLQTHSKEQVKNALSHYANTGAGDFFAEAYSELQNNPKPRQLAKKIGELLDAEIKSQKLET